MGGTASAPPEPPAQTVPQELLRLWQAVEGTRTMLETVATGQQQQDPDQSLRLGHTERPRPFFQGSNAPAVDVLMKGKQDPTPKFVRRKDDITGDEDDLMRVEMSCGHAAGPGSLTGWCRSLLDQGQFKFHCPADVNGKKCGAEWSYQEVRQNASLTEKEQQDFEEKLAHFAAKYYHDFKECPGCKSYVERQDVENLRVDCIICHSQTGKTFEFCWQCLKPWKGAGTPSDKCANEGCKDESLEVLANCKLKDLPGSEIKNCPSIRACPTCGRLIEHMEKCKYVFCPQCQVEFCFACLETTRDCQASKASAYFKYCAKPLAPKQTKVPVWSRK